LKSGSGIGIPSPPAIWNKKSGDIFIPHIRDAERLQGFPSHWSLLPGAPLSDQRARWRLLGNAVSVPISEWLARRILKTRNTVPQGDLVEASDLLPKAAYGYGRTWIAVDAVERPSRHLTPGILDFLKEDGLPLSAGATRGFRERLEDSSLRKNGQFLEALKRHEKRMERASRASRPGPRL
jgi:DNA (cytosine-5)-methyltransferase 1